MPGELNFQGTPYYTDVGSESPSITSFRAQESALLNWLLEMKIRGQQIRATHAWHSRYFAQQSELWKNTSVDKGGNPNRQALPYPLMALVRQGVSPDPTRKTPHTMWTFGAGAPSQTNRQYLNPERTKMAEFPWPSPVNISYTIDMIAKTGDDMLRMETALLERFEFHPSEVFIMADIPVYGRKLIPLEFSEITDNSDLESDTKERTLRRSAQITMKAWIFKTPQEKYAILNGHVVIINADPEGPDGDWYEDISHYTFSDGYRTLDSVTENPATTPPDRVLLWVSFADGELSAIGGQT